MKMKTKAVAKRAVAMVARRVLTFFACVGLDAVMTDVGVFHHGPTWTMRWAIEFFAIFAAMLLVGDVYDEWRKARMLRKQADTR